MSSPKTSTSKPSPNPGETFEQWAIESRQRSALVRQMLAHRTSASGGGCWLPTPTSSEDKYRLQGNSQQSHCLGAMARLNKWPTPLLPTPKASDGSKGSRTKTGAQREWRRGKNVDLGMVVAMWPTPKASPSGPDYARVHRPGSGGDDLATAVAKRIPTPTAGDAKSSGSRNLPGSKAHAGISLTDYVRLPTPTARDWKSGKVSAATHAKNSRPLSEQIGGQLNPTWVEWLMGWPLGFTVLKHWATGKCRSAQRKRGAS